jgi:hypothetical protein
LARRGVGYVRAVFGAARRPSLELTVALVVFAVGWAGLAVLHDRTAPHYRLSARAAIVAAQQDAQVSRYLDRVHFTRAESIPLDRRLRRVTFFDGPRVVLDTAVAPDRTVRFRQEHPPGIAESGSPVANSPLMLALLTALFVLSTAVLPLARLRNLDLLVMTSFVAVVLLLNARLVVASVVVATPALAYLVARCALVGLGRSRVSGMPEASTSLYDHLTRAWPTERRVRLLRLVTGATALAFLMITLTSTGETDVAAASLSGATKLIHGDVPYGHITEGIVHGDTYPLLTYVLYVPGALWMPVTDAFSDLSGALPITAAAALLGAWGLNRIATRPRRAGRPIEPRARRGMLGEGRPADPAASLARAAARPSPGARARRARRHLRGARRLGAGARRRPRDPGDVRRAVLPVPTGLVPRAVARVRALLASGHPSGGAPRPACAGHRARVAQSEAANGPTAARRPERRAPARRAAHGQLLDLGVPPVGVPVCCGGAADRPAPKPGRLG